MIHLIKAKIHYFPTDLNMMMMNPEKISKCYRIKGLAQVAVT